MSQSAVLTAGFIGGPVGGALAGYYSASLETCEAAAKVGIELNNCAPSFWEWAAESPALAGFLVAIAIIVISLGLNELNKRLSS